MRTILRLIYLSPFIVNIFIGDVFAVELYQKKDYKGALEVFMQSKLHNPHQYEISYNLGHIYFRMNDLGSALYYFKKALEENPRFGDSQFNMDYILKKIHNPEQFSKSFWERIPFSTRELLFLSLILSMGFWICVCIPKFQSKAWFLGVFWVSAGFLCVGKYYLSPNYHYILKDKTEVFSNPGTDNIILFTLPLGTQIRYEETYVDGKWEKVSLPNGKKGWIELHVLF